jgi:hypothetical protein
MAEAREQLNAKVAGTTKALLLGYCQEKHATQGDVVDAALRAFLQPPAEEERSAAQAAQLGLLQSLAEQLQTVAAKQDSLELGVDALLPLLTTIVERLEKPPVEPEPPPPPIAEYAQLYTALRPEAGRTEDDADRAEEPAAVPPAGRPSLPARGWGIFTRKAVP